jgi:fatty acid desaturase
MDRLLNGNAFVPDRAAPSASSNAPRAAASSDSPSGASGRDSQLSGVQAECREFLGADEIKRLHSESLALDLLVTFLPLAAAALCFWAVGLPDLPWGGRIGLSLMIAWLLTLNGLVAHDLCVHRLRWGRTLSWLQSAIAFGLLTSSGTGYGRTHIRHHAKIGTPEDTEAYKQDLTTVGRRLAFCTLVGIKLVRSGRWAAPRRRGYYDTGERTPLEQRQARIERYFVIATVLAVLVYAWFDPMRAFMGYFVPLAIIAPVLNTLRIIIEHADTDPSNPYAVGTNYRTGFCGKLFFLADSGDCHLVHHVFPRIPCYRMPAAVRGLRPLIASKGVRERRSYAALLKGWFVNGYPHRSDWPLR